MVASECDRCTITDENGKECGATFKRCVRNGTSALIKHLKTVHSENPEVQMALKDTSARVRNLIEYQTELIGYD